jgi:hypothetical protein
MISLFQLLTKYFSEISGVGLVTVFRDKVCTKCLQLYRSYRKGIDNKHMVDRNV